MSLIAYPILLCEAMEVIGKRAEFNFHLFLNDYEQHKIAGPDPKVFRYNIFPSDTTIQFAPSQDRDKSAADYWTPVIIGAVSEIGRRFPGTKLHPVRNSEMRDSPTFRAVLTETLRSPERIAELIRKTTGKAVLDGAVYALPLFPDDHAPAFDFDIEADDSMTLRRGRQTVGTFAYEELHYWFHHKPLAVPRIHDRNIDVCITGIDHWKEGDFVIRQGLIDLFGLKRAIGDFETIYAPTLVAPDGKKMSKSRGNMQDYPLDQVLEACRQSGDSLEVAVQQLDQSRVAERSTGTAFEQ